MRILLLFLVVFTISCNNPKPTVTPNFKTTFETSEGKETATYMEVIQFYNHLDASYKSIKLLEMGNTDSGFPLHLVIYNPSGEFDFEKIRSKKRVLLVNNGIHPGESDGIDASMLFLRDLASNKINAPENTVVAVIPVYNIGGALNRNSTSRTNQNGPKSYGFRGNAQNYDLNRDFIKSDTRNAKSFAQLFHVVQPDVFIDNHVSNGADYQYAITHLFTQHNKLGGALGTYIENQMMPELEQKLEKKNWPITPYVNVFNSVPENGFSQFKDSPRYSTGYTTLFNTLGMMVETHMLKPYKQRVEGTYEIMNSMLEIVEKDAETIAQLRADTFNSNPKENTWPIQWSLDSEKFKTLNFKGYEGKYVDSELTGLRRLQYDTTKPFEKPVKYNNTFVPSSTITVPEAYVIPQGWHRITELLELNNVAIIPLKKDTLLTVESYKIKDYKTRTSPYEGHYAHYNTTVSTTTKDLLFRAGDKLVYTNQTAFRYIIETLEPSATDSFFNWNFFDTILQQKEGFSPYVWEDLALAYLNKKPDLKREFNAKKANDSSFSKSWYAQLDWIHKRSPNYEKAHLQYPIYRISKKIKKATL
ncbi:MAG: hypothetical protein BM564_10545 [Bacteroidetes bacterium MedPE-SWsnd-G2]|nr:MAG: hypothetical protein BM564_10545 [Bacteroidetes bacterium MedPE-SWsnd-G2]